MRKLMIELDEGPSISICRLICNPRFRRVSGELRKNRTGWWPPASPGFAVAVRPPSEIRAFRRLFSMGKGDLTRAHFQWFGRSSGIPLRRTASQVPSAVGNEVFKSVLRDGRQADP